jgi:hypothetical protein
VDLDRQQKLLNLLEQRRKAAIRRTFARLDPVSLAFGMGMTAGAILLVLTAIHALRGDHPDAPELELLGFFLPGFGLGTRGFLLGPLYGLLLGGIAGVALAGFRNLSLHIVLALAHWSATRWRRRHLLDEVA